jgi:hypothetical protein
MKINLCINCKFYQKGESEHNDMCIHPQSYRGGVRNITNYHCSTMRAGICDQGILFEPSDDYAEYLRDKKINDQEEFLREIAESKIERSEESESGATE